MFPKNFQIIGFTEQQRTQSSTVWHTSHVPLRSDTITCFRWCNDSAIL